MLYIVQGCIMDDKTMYTYRLTRLSRIKLPVSFCWRQIYHISLHRLPAKEGLTSHDVLLSHSPSSKYRVRQRLMCVGQKTNAQALTKAVETEAKKKVERWRKEGNFQERRSDKDFETGLDLSGETEYGLK